MSIEIEWDLLLLAEGIEVGDTLEVENAKGEKLNMLFMGEESKFLVTLLDSKKKKHIFRKVTLDSPKEKLFIVGLSNTPMRLPN